MNRGDRHNDLPASERNFRRALGDPPTFWEQTNDFMEQVKFYSSLGGAILGAGVGEVVHIVNDRSEQITQINNPIIIGVLAGAVIGSACGEIVGWMHAVRRAQILESPET